MSIICTVNLSKFYDFQLRKNKKTSHDQFFCRFSGSGHALNDKE